MMGCTHPFGIEPIRDEDHKIIGGRCLACHREAYVGDSWWTTLKRVFGKRGP